MSTVEPAGNVSIDRENDGAVVVVLEGEHDLGTVPAVQLALEDASDGALVIDLGPATFVDSSILGAVLAAQRECTESGRGFAVACDGSAEPVRRVLELTGLQKELPVYPSREAAVGAALGGGAAP